MTLIIDKTYRSHIPDECIELAAQWWVDRLSPKEDAASKNAEKVGGKQGVLMSRIMSRTKEITPEQLETFKTALVEGLRHCRTGIVWGFNSTGEAWLFVDYEPQGLLLEAATIAKINPFKFPSKTKMYAHYKKLVVIDDDGEQELWAAPAEEKWA